VLYNLISSRAVREVIAESGGTGMRTKNGHSYMKGVMADTGAVFAGEHSGHYYFADNYRADSGLIAALVVLEEMSRTGLPLSELRKSVERYANSGEINTQVKDIDAVIARITEKYSDYPQDRLDGLTVDCGDWWFNVRPSNTEPLLRLNLEAATREQCDTQVAALLQLITA
ncbi:MAG: phosphomannomutase, partial [Actinomycetota bacterium]